MGCKVTKFKGCEIKGSTFNGRKLTLERDISADTFKAVVRTYYNRVTVAEIEGVKNGGDVYFSFTELESLRVGMYIIEYWGEFSGVGTEPFAEEDFTITQSGSSDCGCSDVQPFTIQFEDVTIPVTVNFAVVNIGDGVDLTNYYNKTQSDNLFAQKVHSHNWADIVGKPTSFTPSLHTHSYNDLTDKPTLNFQQILVSGTNIKTVNGQSILGSGNISISAGTSFSGSYLDLTDVPSVFPPSAHSHSWGSVTGKPSFHSVATSGNYSDLNGLPTLFSGSYNDLTNKPTIPAAQVNSDWNATSGAAQILNKPTLFSGNYADLTDKPTLFDGTWNSLSGKPSTFTPSAHTHDSITNQNGGTAVKKWTGTQAQYDAIVTKDNSTVYYII